MRSAAYYHFGGGGLGAPGADIPVTGEHAGGLLADDVAANGWEANDVRWRLIDFGTLPLLRVDELSRFYHPVLPDGSYSATGMVSVDGVDVGESTLTIVWGTVLGESRRIVRLSPIKRTSTAMARRAELLEDMDVQETDTVLFDYSAALLPGETLANANPADSVVTVQVYTGSDPNPSAILSGTRQVSSPNVGQVVQNPVEGVVYLLRCRTKVNPSGRYLVVSAFLRGVRL